MAMPLPRVGQLMTINRTSAIYVGHVPDKYYERGLYVLNTPWGQCLGTIVMPWLNRISPKLARWEAKRQNWKEGEFYPKGSISYVVGLIYRLINRFSRRTDWDYHQLWNQ